MTAVRRLAPLLVALTLIGGLVAACGLDVTLTIVKACNGASVEARVSAQVGFTKEQAVLAPHECTMVVTGGADQDHTVKYNVEASGGKDYVAKIEERRQAVIQQQMADGNDAAKITQLWKDLAALNVQLSAVGADTAGIECGGTIGEGDFVTVTISVNGDKWDCGGVVILTPPPPTPKATP